MIAIYWYIVRLERLAEAWLIQHNGKKNLGIATIHRPHYMRFHNAATGE